METYKATHIKFPENVECLRFLVKLSTDMGLKGWIIVLVPKLANVQGKGNY